MNKIPVCPKCRKAGYEYVDYEPDFIDDEYGGSYVDYTTCCNVEVVWKAI